MKTTKAILVSICSVLLIASLNTYFKQQLVKKQNRERDELRQQLLKWEKIASGSPTYRDAYVQLTIGYQQLGETEKAKVFLQKIFETDPNWQVPAQFPLLP